jgi:O-antigen/teichoic acid export membrane protein
MDAVGRLLIQIAATAILARLLSPEEFGTSALVLTIVATLSVVAGGLPFEEALSQRKVVRRQHFETVLSFCFFLAAVATVLSYLLGGSVGALFGEARFRTFLTASCLILFASAYLTVFTAIARRTKRFNELAQANLVGNVAGAAIAIGLGLLGAGVWALLAFRALMTLVPAVLLSIRFGIVFLPRWSSSHLRDIRTFSGMLFLDRLLETITHLVLSYGVGILYGVTSLGYVNMAVRIVAPVRGAFAGITHNLSFPFFRAASDSADLAEHTRRTLSIATLAAAPTFLGLAALAPLLVPAMAGPGWAEAVAVAALMAIGTSMVCSVQNVHTAMTARGRPITGVIKAILGISVTSVGLVAGTPLGVVAAGLARLGADAAESAWSLYVARRYLMLTPRDIFRHVALPWSAALLMAGAVYVGTVWLSDLASPWAVIAVGMVAGVVLFATLVVLFAGSVRRVRLDWLALKK